MNEGVADVYDTFNTKGCPDKLVFGNFNDQPIPLNYYNFLNYDDYDGNNITGTPVDGVLIYNKGVEDSVIPNDEYNENEIIMDYGYSPASSIDTP